jgi:hypothetical protein
VDAPWLYDADATVQGSPCLALGPDDSPGTRLRTDAALALATLPVVVGTLQSYVPWQTAGVGLVLAGAVAGLRAREPRPPVDSLAAAVAAVALAVLVAQGAAWGVTWALPTTLVALVLAAPSWHGRTREGLRDPRGQALAAPVALAATVAARPPDRAPVGRPRRRGVRAARGRGRGRRRRRPPDRPRGRPRRPVPPPRRSRCPSSARRSSCSGGRSPPGTQPPPPAPTTRPGSRSRNRPRDGGGDRSRVGAGASVVPEPPRVSRGGAKRGR